MFLKSLCILFAEGPTLAHVISLRHSYSRLWLGEDNIPTRTVNLVRCARSLRQQLDDFVLLWRGSRLYESGYRLFTVIPYILRLAK